MGEKMEKLDVKGLPQFLEDDIDALVDAVNSGKKLIDCELSEVLGSIHVSQMSNAISSYTAKVLEDYYIRGGWLHG